MMKEKISILLRDIDYETKELFDKQIKPNHNLYVNDPRTEIINTIQTHSIDLIICGSSILSLENKKVLDKVILQFPHLFVLLLLENNTPIINTDFYLPQVKFMIKPEDENEIKIFVEKIIVEIENAYLINNEFNNLKNRILYLENELAIKSDEVQELLKKRKEYEDENEAHRRQIEALYNSTPAIIYLYDEDGNLVQFNKRHENLTGYSACELQCFKMMDWFKDDYESQRSIYSALNKIALNGFAEAQAMLQKKDGTCIPMFFSARSIQLHGKEYISGIALDLTELNAAETRVGKNEHIENLNFFQDLTSGIAAYKAICNEKNEIIDYQILNVSTLFDNNSGSINKGIKGMTFFEILAKSGSIWSDIFLKVVTTGQSVTFEGYCETHDKDYIATVYPNGGLFFSVVYLDVSAHKINVSKVSR